MYFVYALSDGVIGFAIQVDLVTINSILKLKQSFFSQFCNFVMVAYKNLWNFVKDTRINYLAHAQSNFAISFAFQINIVTII